LLYLFFFFEIDSVFPLVDLTRTLVLAPGVTEYLCRELKPIDFCNKSQPSLNNYFKILDKLISEENLTNTMLVVRLLCNMFKCLRGNIDSISNQKLFSFLLCQRHELINRLLNMISNENKSLQIAYSTLVLNYVILINKLIAQPSSLKEKDDFANQIVLEMIEYFNSTKLCDALLNCDTECIFRILVAVGTLLNCPQQKQTTKEFNLTLFKSMPLFKQTLNSIVTKSEKYQEKIKFCANYLFKLLD
jgi:hypothetical protein